jgi:uncharacterized membrane protein YgcG
MFILNLWAVVIVGIVTITLLWLVWRPRVSRKSRRANKRMAIRNYARRLGGLLHSRYGLQDYYTPDQVQQTIRKSGGSKAYDCYGLAMYCNESDFLDFHRSIGESCNYEEMRHEISDCLTFSHPTFNAADMIGFGASFDHHSSGADNSGLTSSYDAGSGFDGGGSVYDSGGGVDGGGGGY